MNKCIKCGCASYGYHILVGHDYWCSRCLPVEVERLREALRLVEGGYDRMAQQLAAARAAGGGDG